MAIGTEVEANAMPPQMNPIATVLEHREVYDCPADIVEPASNLRGPSCAFPSYFPAVHWLSGDDFVEALLPVIPRKAVLLVRKNVVP
jgi:hypothetical protein